MTIISRYVFRQAGGALVLILGSLSSMVWIALALRQLNIVTSQGQDAWMLFKMTTLALPNLLALIAPFALLIAAIHTLNKLNGDSELIVLTAAGAKVTAVAKPLLLLALLVAIAISYINHEAMPASLRLLRQYIVDVRTNLLAQVIQPGRFTSPEEGVTFHIRDRAPNGELLGFLMHDMRDPALTQSYLAGRAEIVKQDPTAYLLMKQGHIVRRKPGDEPPRLIAFDDYAVDLDKFREKDEDSADLKPRERFYSELVSPERASASYRRAPGQFVSELHERFASPLYPIVFVLVAIACVGQAQSTRRNRMERIVAGIVLAAMLKLGGLAVNNLVTINTALLPLLYGLPALATVLTLIAIRRGATARAGFDLLGRFADTLSDLKERWLPSRPKVPVRRPRASAGKA